MGHLPRHYYKVPELNHCCFPSLQPASPELTAGRTKGRVGTAVGAGSREIPEANQQQSPFLGPELSLGSACRSCLMGTPFPCPDHSSAWLCEGFLSCLRTSHASSHGKPDWKPQEAISLKALCSESSTCLAAPAPAHGAVPLGHGTQKAFTRGAAPQLPAPAREEGLAAPTASPLPQALCLHPSGNTNTQAGARLLNQAEGCSCLFPAHLESEMSQAIKTPSCF